MKSNVEIIQDTIEQVVNQKKIDIWDQYFSQDYISRGAPYIGMGFSSDSSGNKHIINMIARGSPADGKLQVGDELLWVEELNPHFWDSLHHSGISITSTGVTSTIATPYRSSASAYSSGNSIGSGASPCSFSNVASCSQPKASPCIPLT